MSQENVEIVWGVRTPVAVSSETRRRTLDERIFILFPALARALGSAWSRLPPRSRLRRVIASRFARQGFEAWNRRDWDLLLLSLDPGIEYRPAPNLINPDQDKVTYGHDGYLRPIQTWLDAFDDLRFDPEEVIDFGDKLLVMVRWSGHGSGSGVPMSGQLFQLLTQRRGLVQKQEDFGDRAEALEAAGLRE
jgi:ketosteroid isomerase-like protein